MARGLDSYYPWSKIGNAGLACTGLAAGTLWKTLLTRIHPTDVWDTVGGNDLFDGQTTTQLMASKQSIYTAIKAAVTPNPRIWATTLTVNTTSTNGWATALTNQTPAAWATSYLVSANQAIMAGPAQTYRSVDINRPLQAAVDSLNWAAPDQTNIFRVLTPDGIYLNSYASSRAASAVVAALDLPVIAQTTALLARMSVQPDAAHRRAYNAHMMALVNSGALTHLDAYYVEQSHDSQAATLNWVSTSYTLTLNNSPTFTVDRGFTYNGTTSFAGSGFTPTVANANFQRDSAVLLEFVLSKTTGATAADAGCLGTTGATTAIQSCGATGISARINDLAGLAQVSVTNSAGFTAALRSGASVRSCSRDIGLAVTSDSGASTGNTSSELAQGKALSTQFSSREFAYWGFGGFPTGRHLTAICDAQHITNTILNP